MRPCAAALLALVPAPLQAQGTRGWLPDERAIISDYSVVAALAADDARLYVATGNGLGIYDVRFRQWEPPVSFLDGYPRAPVTVALADPAEEAVWLGTAGALFRYRPQIRQWESFRVAGGVLDLAYDLDDPLRGIYVRTRSGWEVLRAGAAFPAPAHDVPAPGRRAGAMSAEELFRRFPAADALRAQVLTDERLRTFQYTAAVRVPTRDDVYLGTNGMGVIHLDPGIVRFESMTFGLLAPGVGAVLTVPGGVWTGTDHRARRTGFTFIDDRLQRYEWQEGARATGFGFGGARDLLMRDDVVWAATDRGVVRFAPGRDVTTRLTSGHGLPDDDSYALAQGPAGVWVGTAFGLALVGDDDVVTRIGRGAPTPVLALAARRDTVWVGTTAGLGVAWPGADGIVVPPDVNATPELKSAVVAVMLRGDTIAAATIDRLIWRRGEEPWRVERALALELGTIHALAPDAGGVWVGGENGLGFFRFTDRTFLFAARRADLPGPVRDLALSGAFLWVATEGGAVRFRVQSLRP